MSSPARARKPAVPSARAIFRLDPAIALGAAACCALLLALAGVLLGPAGLSPERMATVLAEAFSSAEASDPAGSAILLQIRLPRVVLAGLVGAGLAMAGAALQGLFRNPLADPGLIGVTSGAAVGAITSIVLGGVLFAGASEAVRQYATPIAAILGAALTTALVFRFGRVSGALSVATLLLAGVAIQAIAAAFIGVMIYISDDQQLRDLNFWLLGSFGGGDWTAAWLVAAATLICGGALLRFGRALDLLQLGERAAFHSGLDVERVKWRIGALSAGMVGVATAFVGPVGFIGLVSPHLARLIAGAQGRVLMPLSALIGAALTLGADLFVRLIAPPAEPPVGIATSLIGGPFFLWLLARRARRGQV